MRHVSNNVSQKVSYDHYNPKNKPKIQPSKETLSTTSGTLCYQFEDLISEIRHEHHIVMNLSTDKLQSLLDQHLRKALDDDEDRRLSSGPMNSDDGVCPKVS